MYYVEHSMFIESDVDGVGRKSDERRQSFLLVKYSLNIPTFLAYLAQFII